MRRTSLLVVVLAAAAVAGFVLTMNALAPVEEDAAPLARAGADLSSRVSEIQAATSDWTSTASPSAGDEVETARRGLDAAVDELREAVQDDTALTEAVDEEVRATYRWVAEHVVPVLDSRGGESGGDLDQQALGSRLFADVLATRARVDGLVADRLDAAAEGTANWLEATAVALVALAGGAWLGVSATRRRLLSELAEPLVALQEVVRRVRHHDPRVRADAESGPAEVRAVAGALNDVVDEQIRSRNVEGRFRDELRELDSAKDEFVSNVTHELRTPLTTIGGYLEMVTEEFRGRLEPHHARMLEATQRNVVRLSALIDDLLALSRAEVREIDLEPAEVADLVREAVVDLRLNAARRGVRIELVDAAGPVLVASDRPMLYRAFLNVLANAVKFSHEGGRVEVVVRSSDDWVEVVVSDHGIGIPRGELDRLGTRFFRASNAVSQEVPGTGLGLRIVQTIVDKHGGDVVVESLEGAGTTVYVRLRPYVASTLDDPPAPPDAPREAPPEAPPEAEAAETTPSASGDQGETVERAAPAGPAGSAEPAGLGIGGPARR